MSTRFFENPISRSFGLHIMVLLLAFFYITQITKPIFQTDPIEITVIEPPAVTKKIKSDTKRSIVQKSEGEIAEEAKKDSFLSDKTRTVTEERSARNSGEVMVTPAAAATARVDKESVKPKPVNLSDLGMKIIPKVNPSYNQQRNWANAQTGEMMRGGQYIQGMKEGEVSALNTKEFVFFSYYDRVRKQLDQSWQPILRANIQKIYRAGRKLASNEDYVTRTLVTLTSKGEISRVQLLEESGTHDLDQAAVDALNKAGPYPNPPRGLIDESGTVQIRWDFVLKT